MFLLVLLAGVVLRIAALVGFRPAFVIRESSYQLATLDNAASLSGHPAGYGLLELTPLSWFSDALAPVASLQHLLGLATGVLLYVLLLRWGVWRWLAALAAVPALLDPYELASEHMVLPDTLFVFLVTVGLLVLCWRAEPRRAQAFVGGILLGTATTVSLMGEPLVLVAVAAMMLVATTWRRRLAGALVVAVGFGLPLAAYAGWHHHETGEYGLTNGRTTAAPGVGAGFSALFDWAPADSSAYHDAPSWQFRTYTPPQTSPRVDQLYGTHGAEQLSAAQPAANALITYQKHIHTPGPFLLGALLLGVLAALGTGRARASSMSAVCLLAALAPAAMLLEAANTAGLSWRNQIPGLVLFPVAGALALTALLRGRRGRAATRPQIDDVDKTAMATFRSGYGEPALAPVVVVIAAYNEAVGLPQVLATMPASVCGLAADILVVDDGSSDGTAAVATSHERCYLVECLDNRGQGAAMRLGYRVARDHGARYIITTDADGQYDTADFPAVLAPLLDGSADFVTGSRRLGQHHSDDRFRRAGVYVFAWIVSAFTGQRMTDTSFGLRAMRAEVTAAVTLNQPQYQSSELLIGTHSHGFRIAEVPATMHMRSAGSTKKGGNLVYGTRYARVVLGTWWREGCPAPAPQSAPAMLDRRVRVSPSATSER